MHLIETRNRKTHLKSKDPVVKKQFDFQNLQYLVAKEKQIFSLFFNIQTLVKNKNNFFSLIYPKLQQNLNISNC